MAEPPLLARYLPILQWGRTYNGAVLTNDLVAAVIITIMLIPQSLAYALLAGLPPTNSTDDVHDRQGDRP